MRRTSAPAGLWLLRLRRPVLLLAAWLASGGCAAAGDAVRGAQVWQAHCAECHAVADNDTGPRHAGVFGRRAGSLRDFTYSQALKTSGIVWTAGPLDRWLRDPEAYIPGQKMDYSLKDAALRADVIAYLITLKPPR